MKTPMFLGVDPGMNKSKPGAYAIISEDLTRAGAWIWTPEGIPLVAEKLRQLHTAYDIKMCVIEYQRTMPKQGMSTQGKIMRNFGQWEGAIAGLGIPYEIHDPKKWQHAILDSTSRQGDIKAVSTRFAKQRFPSVDLSLVKYQGKADALNIALYARKIFLGQ